MKIFAALEGLWIYVRGHLFNRPVARPTNAPNPSHLNAPAIEELTNPLSYAPFFSSNNKSRISLDLVGDAEDHAVLKSDQHLLFRNGCGPTTSVPDEVIHDVMYSSLEEFGFCKVELKLVPSWGCELSLEDAREVSVDASGCHEIAVKTVGGTYDPYGATYDIFKNEVHVNLALKQRRHPHITPIICSYQQQTVIDCKPKPISTPTYSIAMPYYSLTLKNVLRFEDNSPRTERQEANASHLPENMRRTLLQTFLAIGCLADVIDFFHNQFHVCFPDFSRIYHHDLKPINILLDPQLQVRIADFGSSSLKRTTETTRTETAKSTEIYKAPEMDLRWSRSGRRTYGRQVDIWALGCIFLEIITFVCCTTTTSGVSAVSLFEMYRKHEHRAYKDNTNRVNKWINWLKDATKRPDSPTPGPHVGETRLLLRTFNTSKGEHPPWEPGSLGALLDLVKQMLDRQEHRRPLAEEIKKRLFESPIRLVRLTCCENPTLPESMVIPPSPFPEPSPRAHYLQIPGTSEGSSSSISTSELSPEDFARPEFTPTSPLGRTRCRSGCSCNGCTDQSSELSVAWSPGDKIVNCTAMAGKAKNGLHAAGRHHKSSSCSGLELANPCWRPLRVREGSTVTG